MTGTGSTPGQRLAKCARCGWVHLVLTPEQVAHYAPTPEDQANYRRCMRCGADSSSFIDTDGCEVPVGCTVPACIVTPN